jgi:hypothetical protein
VVVVAYCQPGERAGPAVQDEHRDPFSHSIVDFDSIYQWHTVESAGATRQSETDFFS